MSFDAQDLPKHTHKKAVEGIENAMQQCTRCTANSVDEIEDACITHMRQYNTIKDFKEL